jgi:hypothetical protein
MQWISMGSLALAWFAAAPAWAQSECDRVPEGTRARCEEAMRIKQACKGLQGDALKACQQKNVTSQNLKEDCSRLAGDAKASCLAGKRTLGKAGPCSGKTGAELQACLRTEVAKAGQCSGKTGAELETCIRTEVTKLPR